MKPIIAVLANLTRFDAGEFSLRDTIPRSYVDALTLGGAHPLLLPCLDDPEAVTRLLALADGVLITGGEDVAPRHYGQPPHANLGGISPLRDIMDRLVVEDCLAHPDRPVLGICRGIQALAVFAGGSLIQDIPSQVPNAIQHSQRAPGDQGHHELTITPGSLLAEITGEATIMVNTFHHQAVAQLPDGFIVSATAPDGVTEVMEKPQANFCLGFQCHPELMVRSQAFARRLFERFVAACG